MLNNKELKFLEYISKYESIEITALLIEFNISTRSIQNYIRNIQTFIPNAKIYIKSGYLHLTNTEVIKEYLQENIVIPHSANLKKLLLIYSLLKNDHLNISTMANNLEISRSSVKNYLEEINALLTKNNLSLVSDHKKGLRLVGDETNIRQLFLQLFFEYKKLSKFEQKNLNFYFNSYNNIHSLIKSFVNSILIEENIQLSDSSFEIVEAYIQILIHRSSQNKVVGYFNNDVALSTNIIKNFTDLCDEFNFKYSKIELQYLLQFIKNCSYTHHLFNNIDNWFDYHLLVVKIIDLFSNEINLNLNLDHQLYRSLMLHIKPTMFRLENNIRLEDINVIEVINKYPNEFQITKNVLNKLNFFTSHNFDNNELALVTIHFLTAINRIKNISNTKKHQVLIVCSHGYGTSKLLEQQLSEKYAINVVDCIALNRINQFIIDESIDYIITTIKSLNLNCNTNIIHVNPILSTEDFHTLDSCLDKNTLNKIKLSELLTIIEENTHIHDKPKLINTLKNKFSNTLIDDLSNTKLTLLDLLPIENILMYDSFLDWQSVILDAGQFLVTNNYAMPMYKDNLLYSFNNYGSYMIIDDLISIPHASTHDGEIIKSGIVLTVLKQPVIFENRPLSIFFTFCSRNNTEHVEALITIANLIKESNFKDAVTNNNISKDALYYLIKDFVYNEKIN